MSFIDSVSKIAKGVGKFFTSSSIGSSLAKTALLGFALSKVAKSINKQNDAQQDTGAQVNITPDTSNNVPVIYGQSYTNGIITDAYLAPDKKTMWACLTICEMTGNKIDGTASQISIDEVYYDGFRLIFSTDGNTVQTIYDDSGNSSDKFNGLIKVYGFVDGSSNPVRFSTETAGNGTTADNLFPNWTANHDMSGLVFAIVKITYNAKNKVTSLGNFQFKISNTMNQPGDVLFDYMTNTRYGASIPQGEIFIS